MPADAPEPYRLHLLGPWDLRGPKGRSVRSVLSQPPRLCLLAYLALSGEPVSRSRIVSVFWPESDKDHARNALSQAVHYLRRSLSKAAVESVEGDRLRVPPEVVWFDGRELLEDASPGSDVVEAADGEFMEGWNADDSPPLQEWLDGVRRKVRERGEGVRREAGVSGGAAGFFSARRRVVAAAVIATLASVAVGVLLFAGGVWPAAASADRAVPESPASADVAVLMPQMIVVGDTPLSASSVHDEVLALLDALEGPRIVAVPWAESVQELRRFLTAVGGDDQPEWVLSISVRAYEMEARVIGVLYRGPDYAVAGTMTGDYGYESEAEALLGIPREIAGDVVGALGGT